MLPTSSRGKLQPSSFTILYVTVCACVSVCVSVCLSVCVCVFVSQYAMFVVRSRYEHSLTPALAPGIPRSKIGAGLGVWNGSDVQPWDLSAKSAEERICALMNHSFTELDMFILSQGSADPAKNFPYDYWIPQLEKFVGGGGCPLPYLDPDPMVPVGRCPSASAGMPKYSWLPGGETAGCESTTKRAVGQRQRLSSSLCWLPLSIYRYIHLYLYLNLCVSLF